MISPGHKSDGSISISCAGLFVTLNGYQRHGLVHHSQVSEEVSFGQEDEDDDKITALEYFFPQNARVGCAFLQASLPLDHSRKQQGSSLYGIEAVVFPNNCTFQFVAGWNKKVQCWRKRDAHKMSEAVLVNAQISSMKAGVCHKSERSVFSFLIMEISWRQRFNPQGTVAKRAHFAWLNLLL